MTIEEAARIVLSSQDQTHEMLVQTMFLLRLAIWFLIVATVMGVFVIGVQIYEVILHRRTIRKIDDFLFWAQKYMDHQGPIQEQVLSLISLVQERATGTLNKIEDTVKKGTEASTAATELAATKAAEVVATALSNIPAQPLSDPGNKIPVIQGV